MAMHLPSDFAPVKGCCWDCGAMFASFAETEAHTCLTVRKLLDLGEVDDLSREDLIRLAEWV